MQRVIRAAVASAVAASAALLIGAGTANAATPAHSPVLAAAASTTTGSSGASSTTGSSGVLGSVFSTIANLLGNLGL
jgi:hypothetical protein